MRTSHRIWWWPDLILQTEFLGNFASKFLFLSEFFPSQILDRVIRKTIKKIVSEPLPSPLLLILSPLQLIHLPPSPLEIFFFSYLSWWFDWKCSTFSFPWRTFGGLEQCALSISLINSLRNFGISDEQFLNKELLDFFPSTPPEIVYVTLFPLISSTGQLFQLLTSIIHVQWLCVLNSLISMKSP